MARQTLPDILEQTGPRPGISRSLPLNLLLSLRPSQWTKNLVVFAALGLGQRLLDAPSVL
jgi:hypothetical protein